MSVVTPIQTSFAGGEISPRLRGQAGSDLYRAALALAQDWRPTPQGSLLKRPGSRYVAGGWAGVLKHLPLSGKAGYLLNFSEKFVSAFNAAGLYERAGAALAHGAGGSGAGQTYYDLVTNGYFGAATSWTTVSGTVDFAWHSWNYGVIAYTPEHVAAAAVDGMKIRQTLTAREAGTHVLRFSLLTAHSGNLPDGQTYALADGKTFYVKVGTTSGASDLLAFSVTSTTAFNGTKDAHYCLDVVVAAAGSVYLEIESNGYAYVSGVSFCSPSGFMTMATPWTAAQLAEIQTVPLLDRVGLVVVHPDVAPWLIFLDDYGYWRAGAITFTGTPAAWGEANYPSCCEVYQGRLWLAGCQVPADGFWASKVNDYDDLGLGTGVATDGLAYQIAAKAGIRWMRGFQGALFVGTESGEHAIRSQAGVICTADLQVTDESTFGSAPVESELVGSQALYVSRDQRKVRALSFTQERQAWTSDDVSFPAEHLFSSVIEQIASVRDPDGVLALRLANGDLACCTYLPGRGAAWWRLSLGGVSSIESMAVTHDAQSVLWCLVKRGTDYLIETLTFTSQAADEYLDCWVQKALVASAALDGLPLPYGQAVSVMVDGVLVQSNVTTVPGTGGSALTLAAPYTSTDVVVGAAYTSTATTLPIEAGSQRGTAQGSKRRWPKIRARLVNSAMPSLAGELPPGNAATLADQDVEVNSLGHDSQGAVSVVQALPYRTELVALFGILHGSEV